MNMIQNIKHLVVGLIILTFVRTAIYQDNVLSLLRIIFAGSHQELGKSSMQN